MKDLKSYHQEGLYSFSSMMNRSRSHRQSHHQTHEILLIFIHLPPTQWLPLSQATPKAPWSEQQNGRMYYRDQEHKSWQDFSLSLAHIISSEALLFLFDIDINPTRIPTWFAVLLRWSKWTWHGADKLLGRHRTNKNVLMASSFSLWQESESTLLRSALPQR